MSTTGALDWREILVAGHTTFLEGDSTGFEEIDDFIAPSAPRLCPNCHGH